MKDANNSEVLLTESGEMYVTDEQWFSIQEDFQRTLDIYPKKCDVTPEIRQLYMDWVIKGRVVCYRYYKLTTEEIYYLVNKRIEYFREMMKKSGGTKFQEIGYIWNYQKLFGDALVDFYDEVKKEIECDMKS